MESTVGGVLQLPQEEVLLLEHPPLKLTLCQIRFPTQLSVSQPQAISAFQAAVQDRFPILQELPGLQIQMTLGPGNLIPSQPVTGWEFSDNDDAWKLVLTRDFLTLETRAYARFEDFLQRLHEVLNALVKHIGPRFVTRVGLRYINEIRVPTRDWKDIIRPELLGAVGTLPIGAAVAKESHQQIMLRDPDGDGININHGLISGGFMVPPAQGEMSSEGPFYLLDIDAFRESARPHLISLDVQSICDMVQKFNQTIYQLFRWSITDEYVRSLGVRTR